MVCRRVGLLSLLGAEVVGLTIRFDSGVARTEILGTLVGTSRFLLQILVAGAAVLLLLGTRCRQWLAQESAESLRSHRSWAYLLAHLAALAGFTWLTSVVLEGGSKQIFWALIWAIAWAATGLLTLVLWIAVSVPPGRWLRLARSELGMLLGGATAGLAAWGAGRIANGLWEPFSRPTLKIVHCLLLLFFQDTVLEPREYLVGTSNFQVTIAPGCSGFEGIGLVLVLIGSFLWLSRGDLRFPHALVLLPLGASAIWGLNAIRIVILITFGTYGLQSLAIGGFHSVAGWLALTAVGLGLIAAARSWSFITREDSHIARDEIASPSAPYLMPLIAIVTTAMITQAFTDGFDWIYPLRVVVTCFVFWIYRRRYDDLRWTFSWQSVALGTIAFVVWVALEGFALPKLNVTLAAPDGPGELKGTWMIAWLFFRVVGSVLTVPLAEELAFRGYLTRRLIRAEYWSLPIGIFTWSSFLLSSVLFGMLHGRWIAGSLSGMIFAIALYRRNELTDAVVAHATTNALIALFVLTTGDWSMWV